MKKTSPEPSVRQERSRHSLLEAGARQFIQYGFRRTSMEAIAADAKVAKATAYAHFANKEAVFAAVVEHVSRQLFVAAALAASRAKTPEAAVLASLTTKEVGMYERVYRSPHAAELLAAFISASGTQTESAHADYVAALEALLKRCARIGPRQSHAVAMMLEQAAYGLAARATDERQLRSGLALLVERVLAHPR